MKFKHTLIALAGSALLATGMAQAADNTATTSAPATRMTDRQMAQPNNAMGVERDMLVQKLRAGTNRADYERILKDNGFRVSGINEDKKDYLEYEVVKGQNSYEVQVDFKDGAKRASNVEVAPNMWRSEATERMVKDPNYQYTGAMAVDSKAKYSDRRNMKGWTNEKDRLQKALPMNLKAADYRSKIEGMGYKVTAVNDREKDYVEYEIAKGENSYEVQIDLDARTGMASKVDVTSNLWEAEATERATDKKKM